MKYFTELLESYSKLKKRKLKLLTEASTLNPDAVNLAQKYIKDAKADPTGQNKIPVADLNQHPLNGQVWVSQSGNSKGKVVFDGLPGLNGRPMNIEPGAGGKGAIYSQFVKLLSGGKSEGQSEEKTATGETMGSPELPPEYVGGAVTQSEAFLDPNVDPSIMQEIVDNLREAATKTTDVYNTIKALFRGSVVSQKSSNDFRALFFGKRTGSLETKIALSKVYKLNKNEETGDFEIQEAPQDSKLILDWSLVQKQLFDYLSRGEEEIKNNIDWFSNTFAFNSNGSLTIYTDTGKGESGRQGVVVEHEGLKEILKNINDRYAKDENKIAILNINKIASPGFNNYIRGTLLEEVAIIFTLASREKAARMSGDNESADRWQAIRDMKLRDEKLKNKLLKLSSLKESWTTKARDFSVTVEEQEELESLKALLGKDNKENLYNLLKAAKMIHKRLREKNPFLVLHSGKDVGFGKKKDTMEVYLEPAPGRVKVSTDKLAQMSPEFAEYYSQKLIAPGEVFIETQSYKHYLESSKNVSFTGGSTSLDSSLNLVIPNRDPLNEQKRLELRSLLSKKIIGGSKALGGLQAFASNIDEVLNKIVAVSNNNIDPKTGKSRDRATQVIDAVEKQLNSQFDEKDKKRFCKGLSAKLSAYREAGEAKKKEIFESIKGDLASLTTNLSIKKGMDSGNDSAKNLLISRFVNCGAGVDPGLSTYARVLGAEKDRSYQFSQNKIIDFCVEVIKGTKEGYKIALENDNWVVRNPAGKSIIRLDSASSGKAEDRFSYNEECIKELSAEIGLTESQTRDELINLLLENQKNILMALFKL